MLLFNDILINHHLKTDYKKRTLENKISIHIYLIYLFDVLYCSVEIENSQVKN